MLTRLTRSDESFRYISIQIFQGSTTVIGSSSGFCWRVPSVRFRRRRRNDQRPPRRKRLSDRSENSTGMRRRGFSAVRFDPHAGLRMRSVVRSRDAGGVVRVDFRQSFRVRSQHVRAPSFGSSFRNIQRMLEKRLKILGHFKSRHIFVSRRG